MQKMSLTKLNGKSPREIRNTRDVLQLNKGNIPQAHNQHQPKRRKTQNISSKIGNKTKTSAFFIPTQYSN